MCSDLIATKARRHKEIYMTEQERRNREELLAKEIVDCAYRVHKQLGPGLLEKIYEVCFCHELTKKGIPFQRQVDIAIVMMSLFLMKDYG
jgi:hypothetical protein